ncbi:uncharacterized protein BJX67DRAFT_343176 [Aspergillus lucknowensis]|uniref:Adenylyltransferase AadA C-terminal domain-containing protein n=1 Tax=Aspergillus lucknowensis TaxID=176173 RepID=A0ABR4M2I4_9EURO
MLESQVNAYLTSLVERLHEELENNLFAVHLFGSAGYGSYEHGASDIDVYTIIHEPLPPPKYHQLTQKINHHAIPCPARRLEFVLLSRANAAAQTPVINYEMNFNTGRGMDDHIGLDPSAEPRFWFLLDVAIGRDLGTVLYGPPPQEILAKPKPEWILDCMIESLDWHRDHLPITSDGILNVCRALRAVKTGKWGSKLDGGAWATKFYDKLDIVAVASRARRSNEQIPQDKALDFLAFAERQLQGSRAALQVGEES